MGELKYSRGSRKFNIITEDNIEVQYEGDFSNGYFDGIGTMKIKANDEKLETYGTYSNGVYKPTIGELFNFIGQMKILEVELQMKL